jgi:hypothetical protein
MKKKLGYLVLLTTLCLTITMFTTNKASAEEKEPGVFDNVNSIVKVLPLENY